MVLRLCNILYLFSVKPLNPETVHDVPKYASILDYNLRLGMLNIFVIVFHLWHWVYTFPLFFFT